MKVLHAHAGNIFGGIETMLLAFAEVRDEDVTHGFALAFDDTFADRLRRIGHDPDLLGPVRLSRPWTVWRARRRLGRTLRANRPDVVIVHSVWSLVAYGPAVRRAGLPLVAWLHTPPTGDQPLDRLARRHPPDLLIANSRYTASGVPQLYPDVPVDVVHPAVPFDPPTAEERAACRTELGAGPDQVVLCQAARMERGKGQQVLIETLPAVPGPWVCWMLGGAATARAAAWRRELERRAATLGIADRVRFLGARDEARRVIGSADVLVHPNIEPESFGIVLVEAMAAGVPVVTSAMGGGVEAVNDTTAVLLPPGDIGTLRDALAELVRDPGLRRRLGAAGPERARTVADPAAQTAALVAVLARVVD